MKDDNSWILRGNTSETSHGYPWGVDWLVGGRQLAPRCVEHWNRVYAVPVLKNVTITLDPEVAHWARRKAADENTSVSKLVGRLLEKEMRASDSYWRAYEEWKRLPDDLGGSIDASKRFTRDEAHERR